MASKCTSRNVPVYLIGFGMMFLFADCIVLNANKETPFSPGDKAEFECIINPYTSSQTWYLNDIYVASCGFAACNENTSNPTRFSFQKDLNAGNFIFKIDSVSMSDDGSVVRCHDGTVNKTKTINVEVNVSDGGGSNLGFLFILVLIPIAIVIIICCYRLIFKAQPEQPSVNSEAHETEILLKWETPACRGNPSLKYLVKWRKEGLHRFEQNEVTTMNCNIDKLNPAETYDIKVYAINNGRKSNPWKTKILTESVTLKIKIKDPRADHCIIQWTTKTIQELELKYMVEYCWAEDYDWIKYGQILNTRQTCLKSLRHNKRYKIRVYAIYKSKVLNPPGIKEFVTTLDESPNTGRDMLDVEQWDTQEHNEESHLPEATRFTANYDSTYNRCDITWNVTRSGKPLSKIQYMLEYTLNNGIEWNKQGIILDEPKTCLESLERNKCYKIRVYAIYQSFIQEVPGKGNFIT